VGFRIEDLDRIDRDKIQINTVTRCWEWTAALTKDGYGQARRSGKNVKAHRHVYQVLVGPLAPGVQQLDHLCRVRRCVNPDHLEPVTPLENIRRGLPAVSAPLPDDIQLSIVKAIEDTYRRGVLDGMRRALSVKQ
jgi:hypothetical protein